VIADRDRAAELVGEWRRVRAEGTHLSPFGLDELAGRIMRALEAVRAEALAEATSSTGARVVEAWRDARPHPLAPIEGRELGHLEWLIDETVLGARLEGERACAFAAVCEIEHPTTLELMRRRAGS
jgi:hypothetical protein